MCGERLRAGSPHCSHQLHVAVERLNCGLADLRNAVSVENKVHTEFGRFSTKKKSNILVVFNIDYGLEE